MIFNRLIRVEYLSVIVSMPLFHFIYNDSVDLQVCNLVNETLLLCEVVEADHCQKG